MKFIKGIYAVAVVAALSLPMVAQNGAWGAAKDSARDEQRQREWERDRDRDRDRDWDRDRDRDRDHDRDRWNRRDSWNRYRQAAYNNGYNAGLNEGREDRWRNKKFKYGKEYKRASYGYRGEFGDRDRYKQEFRRGYEEGYRRGYNSGGGWYGDRRDGRGWFLGR